MSEQTRKVWEQYAEAIQRKGTPGIVQIVHPGRQSPVKSGNKGFLEKTIAPSAIPLNLGPGLLDKLVGALVFGTPREMTLGDIDEVVQQFATGAKAVYEAGFKGIELHAAHGYLLSQFLSPTSNQRTDAYGGNAAKRAQIVIDVIRAVRKQVPASFCVGLKLNSADSGGAGNLEESLEQVGLIAAEQIDFLEISGGSYENPRMFAADSPRAARTAAREAFFLDYAKAVRARYPNIILMVTGGFRSREGMKAALESNACDLIGIGRPAAIYPHWPKDVILNEEVEDKDAVVKLSLVKPKGLAAWIPVRLIHAGVDAIYYAGQIQRIGEGKTTIPPPEG
jgi:2,4-dienoyl-CoA reductase-like NADH-dependent reductase (Old Yellow Enzyme family)